jgi:hypothetical protein
MGVQEFADTVSSNPEEYSPRTRRQANLAKTLKKIRKGEDGMEVPENKMDMEMEPIEALDPKLEWAKKDIENLERQAEKENVLRYQKMLNDKYGAGLSVDGAWGPKTQAAYEKFVLKKGASAKPATKGKDQWYTEEEWDKAVASQKGGNTPAAKTTPKASNKDWYTPEQWDNAMNSQRSSMKQRPSMPTSTMPKLNDYMTAPKAVNTRSYSDNATANDKVRPTTSVPTFKQPTPKTPKTPTMTGPSFNQAPTGYRSAGYLNLLERMRKGQMKSGGMKKKY